MKKILFLFVMLLPFATISYAENIFYVQSLKTFIYSEPQLGSNQIGELKKGDKVMVIEKKPEWVRVEISGKAGWIPSIFLSPSPPVTKVSIFEKDIDQSIKESARRRASDYVTAAAVRGLLEDRLRTNQKYILDLNSVKWLENIKISEEELNLFLESR